ncbi:unnamed protein product [uncultured bacterium]|nr:unnamed protein product [uncultured bacterium]
MIRPFLRRLRQRADRLRGEATRRSRRRTVARAIETIPPVPDLSATSGATLFFVPYAGVSSMFAQTCVVARTLKELGHRVLVARCFELFERCPVMSAYRLPFDAGMAEKHDICLHCADNSLAMTDAYGLDVFDLRTLVNGEMISSIDAALAASSDNLLEFEFDGVAFGMVSGADLVLTRKITDLSAISDQDRRTWLQYLRGCLLSYLMIDLACRQYHVGRIVHVNDYSMLVGARLAARKHRIPCYGLSSPAHCNVDFRRYLIMPDVWVQSTATLVRAWPVVRDLPLDPERVGEVGDDLLVRFSGLGVHIYSPPKTMANAATTSVTERLGLVTDRALIVAYTSSLDEAISIRMTAAALNLKLPEPPQPFADQIEWLSALVDRVESSRDLQLVVRVHPREAANKRESVTSQHLDRLRAAFGGTYAHCRFVWPQDAISSYDLGEAADLALIWGSTIGLELARLGVPVLAATHVANYPSPVDDFLEWDETEKGYFETLRRLLERPISIDQVARAFRWYHLLGFGATVDLADVVPDRSFDRLPEYRQPAEAGVIEDTIIRGRDICDINIRRLQAAQQRDSGDRELAELRRQLRRVVHFLMTGIETDRDAPLWLLPGDESATPGVRSAAVNGRTVHYHDGARVITRVSPMAARLVPLCAEARVLARCP